MAPSVLLPNTPFLQNHSLVLLRSSLITKPPLKQSVTILTSSKSHAISTLRSLPNFLKITPTNRSYNPSWWACVKVFGLVQICKMDIPSLTTNHNTHQGTTDTVTSCYPSVIRK